MNAGENSNEVRFLRIYFKREGVIVSPVKIMKVKSSVLFGLIVLICSISGFSLLKRMTREIDEWRPSDLYSSSNISRRSTFSVVSSAPVSYSESVVTVSSGSSSMFRHRDVSLYAPASGFTYSQYPIASSPLVSSPNGGLYTTSSAEIRSFGGGGNGGTVSMSGGSIKASNSPVASASSLSISMPSNSIYAYNTNGNGVASRDVMSSVSGDIAMASTQSYTGIGNTTGPRGMSGRKNAAPGRDPYDVWLEWLRKNGQGYGENVGGVDGGGNIYNWDYEDAWNAFCAWFSMAYPGSSPDDYTGADATILWDQWLSWFMSNNGTHTDSAGNIYNFLPIGDYLPLLVMAVLYIGYIAIRRRNKWENINTLS